MNPSDGLLTAAVMVVSVHGRDAGVLSPINGWQVVQVTSDGQHAVGDVYPRRTHATAFASRHFEDIVGWKRLESTAWLAERRGDRTAPVSPPLPSPTPKGPQIPRWRLAQGHASGAARR